MGFIFFVIFILFFMIALCKAISYEFETDNQRMQVAFFSNGGVAKSPNSRIEKEKAELEKMLVPGEMISKAVRIRQAHGILAIFIFVILFFVSLPVACIFLVLFMEIFKGMAACTNRGRLLIAWKHVLSGDKYQSYDLSQMTALSYRRSFFNLYGGENLIISFASGNRLKLEMPLIDTKWPDHKYNKEWFMSILQGHATRNCMRQMQLKQYGQSDIVLSSEMLKGKDGQPIYFKPYPVKYENNEPRGMIEIGFEEVVTYFNFAKHILISISSCCLGFTIVNIIYLIVIEGENVLGVITCIAFMLISIIGFILAPILERTNRNIILNSPVRSEMLENVRNHLLIKKNGHIVTENCIYSRKKYIYIKDIIEVITKGDLTGYKLRNGEIDVIKGKDIMQAVLYALSKLGINVSVREAEKSDNISAKRSEYLKAENSDCIHFY